MAYLTTIDDTGRIYIPKAVRKELNLEKGTLLNMRVERGSIVLWAGDSASDEYFGYVRVDARVDLDRKLQEYRGGEE